MNKPIRSYKHKYSLHIRRIKRSRMSLLNRKYRNDFYAPKKKREIFIFSFLNYISYCLGSFAKISYLIGF
jgi:hypothetical protein